MRYLVLSALVSVFLCACANYTWTNRVPAEKRTVSVPTFRNETSVTRLGSVVSAQVSREFMREGTFSIASDGAYEVQGTLTHFSGSTMNLARGNTLRTRDYALHAKACVSVVDKTTNTIVIDAKQYEVRTTVASGHDLVTAERNASGRIAEEFARQIVDDLVDCASSRKENK